MLHFEANLVVEKHHTIEYRQYHYHSAPVASTSSASDRVVVCLLLVTRVRVQVLVPLVLLALPHGGHQAGPPHPALLHEARQPPYPRPLLQPPNLGAAEPPLAGSARKGGVGLVYGELAVVEAPVLAFLEEVGAAVVPLEGGVYTTGREVALGRLFNIQERSILVRIKGNIRTF